MKAEWWAVTAALRGGSEWTVQWGSPAGLGWGHSLALWGVTLEEYVWGEKLARDWLSGSTCDFWESVSFMHCFLFHLLSEVNASWLLR